MNSWAQMKHFISKLKKDKIDLFKKEYHEMVAAYNREVSTTRGYNGRQILELLQNCDDQKSKKIVIKIDRENNRLSIANEGIPFSQDGYRSLITSNLSSKINLTQYIGNKGLGFRSILNWSESVAIYSNGIKVTYSNELREKTFKSIFEESIIKEIRDKFRMSDSIFPLPILTVPDIIETEHFNEFATVIELQFKPEYLTDIIKQIQAIDAETILFLHHIKSIVFEGFSEKEDILIQRNMDDLMEGSIQRIVSESEIWDIYQDEDQMPDRFQNANSELENYQIRIAIPRKKPKNRYKLFSFFSTNITLDFPYIIHATFDLDQNRKHLENSKKNEFVVEKLTQLMCKMALLKTKGEVDWSAYKLVQYSNKHENLEELNFYERLDEIIQKEAIVPCVSNTFHSLNDTVYIDDIFSKLLVSGKGGGIFTKHIKPLSSGISFETRKPRFSGYKSFSDYIDKWSLSISDIKIRAQLIQYLVNRNNSNSSSETFNILINGNSKIIDKKSEIFTHINSDLQIPVFCSIEVMHPQLFEELVTVFKIKEDSKKDTARTLQSLLKNIGNVHTYEFLPLSRKIVKYTNEITVQRPDKSKGLVIEMLSALYHNFDPEINHTSIGIQDVPIFDSEGEIVKATNLFFSNNYYLGQLCEDIFGEIHQNRNQVASPIQLGFKDDDLHSIQVFLGWLGVNKHVKYKLININSPNNRYVRRVVRYTPTTATVQVLDFENREEILKNIKPEQFLLWVINDTKLSDNLNQLEKKHGETVHFKYHTNQSRVSRKSYLAELIEKDYYNFHNHLLDNAFKTINDVEINYANSLFKKYRIKRKDLDFTLRLLGARSDFNELSIERVQDILEKVNNKYPNGRNTSTYYRRAYLHFEENQENLTRPLNLFAKGENGLKLYNQEKIYFSDKIKLPNKLRSRFPVFNFPRRSGGKKAIEFFSINDLSQIEINLFSHKKDDLLTKLLHDYLTELYPYILIHRISALDNEKTKRTEGSKLQKLHINVCSDVITEVDEEQFILDDYEFIFLKDQGYFLKLPKTDKIEGVKNNSNFKDAIAGVLSNLFDVSGHKGDFRAILSTDLNDVKHITKINFGEDLLDETLAILGFTNSKISFWSTVYRLKGLELNFSDDNDIDLDSVNKDLNLSLTSHLPNYNDLNDKDNITYFQDLFSRLQISINEFNSYSVNHIDYYNTHLHRLSSFFINNFLSFRQSLHYYSETIPIRKKFLQNLHEYEIRSEAFVKRIALEKRFEFALANQEHFDLFMTSQFEDISLIETDKYKDLDAIFNKNKKLLSPSQLDVIENDHSLKSLLYFEISLEEISKFFVAKPKIRLKSLTNKRKSKENGSYSEKRVDSFKTKNWSGYKNRKNLFVPNVKSGNDNTQIGKNSENKVYDHLCSKYGKEFVHYKAKEDEGLHYDIRYSPDKGLKYIYVEVKTFSNNSFIISREEFEFGKENKDRYEIWLVKNDNLIVFSHNLEEVDLVVKDYYVAFSELEIN